MRHNSKKVLVSEKTLERRLKHAVELRGGKYVKQAYTRAGDPDRMCLLPVNLVWFVELKSEGKQPSKLQAARLRELKQMGFNTKVVNDNKSYLELITDFDNHQLIQ